MLVDDPEDTLEALNQTRASTITWESFKTQYEKIKNRTRVPVHDKTIDTHFYTLSIFQFISPIQGRVGEYKLTMAGEDVCKVVSSKSLVDKERLASILRSVLLSSPDKGTLFRQFLEYVKEPKSRSELTKKFRPRPAKTLIAWSKAAHLIEVDGEFVWKLHPLEIPKPSLDQFYATLLPTYRQMQRTPTPGVKQVFVDIIELRRNTCYKLKGLSIDEFDKLLREVLSGPKGRTVRLYGAPTATFEDKRNFTNKGKVYAYLSMEV